ncbi:hypothetical protein Agabi119p4_7739 [Agaricus bisporus var. burnettii]|uniref:Uncharacterized protein n=1 Tax=Agaricus bisporus var. burnettii TaxID=192524 RepID=A0A8H7C8P2_AGABI|nr:hypothetical protein Agabi119p4_7739 [Agaricus bisporus var. burnettii]
MTVDPSSSPPSFLPSPPSPSSPTLLIALLGLYSRRFFAYFGRFFGGFLEEILWSLTIPFLIITPSSSLPHHPILSFCIDCIQFDLECLKYLLV